MQKRKLKLNKYLSFFGFLLVALGWLGGWVNGGQSVWGGDGLSPAETVSQMNYEAALAERQQSFTVQGEPVNPRAVAAMMPWLSDRLPGAIAVDIEGTTADTNQFYADIAVDEAGRVTAAWEQFGERRFVVYQSMGQLTDGTYVLRVFVNTGGNAVFPSLMWVKASLDEELWWNGESRPRLTLHRRGGLVLGVGYAGDITVTGQSVTLTPAPRSGEAAMTLDLPPL
ncbi:MAG: hypothetical protein AAGG53_07860 [Cyanobacteria bacterium P01_H01_bin.152]